ncbi:hypothetical protein A0H81_13337 [Grifola frondosa]|uniref:Uncharacterized protein n=1 Tax=Grifola frondosa TaxID=5627 RepID=A0A1C7LQ22_GRIFR|nr:hypothetical protein A0H81_13337 [Grifola frondosa]
MLSLSVADDKTKGVITALLSGLAYAFPQTRPNTDPASALSRDRCVEHYTQPHVPGESPRRELHHHRDLLQPHSAEHQYYIALYTACSIYVDDHGAADPVSVGEFSQRFANDRKQLDPVFDCYAALLQNAQALWPAVAANAIVRAALEFKTAVYVECTTGKMAVSPSIIPTISA